MDNEKLCNEIFNLDPLIRFTAIINKNGEKIAGRYRENLTPMLSPEEAKMSVFYARTRWEARANLSHKIGKAKYSTTTYEKLKQITMPVGGKDLLLISTDPPANQLQIIDQVLELIEKN